MAPPAGKLASIALVCALMIMWVLPLAPSLSVGGLGGAGENHYCEVSKGPCRHGDSCPVGHHKKAKSAHHAKGEHAGHAAHDGQAADSAHADAHSNHSNDDSAPLGAAFTCHGSAGAHAAEIAVIPASTNPPYMLAAYLAPGLDPAPGARDVSYRDIDIAPPVFPPRLA